MTDYSSLATDPKEFLALTGYTVAEFGALLPAFTACFTAKMRTTALAGNPASGLMSATGTVLCRRWRTNCCSS